MISKFNRIYRRLIAEQMDFLAMLNQPKQKQQNTFVQFLDDNSWDNQKKVKKLKSELKKLKEEAQKNKVEPKKAKEELITLFNTTKQHNPEIAKQIKDDIKQDINVIKQSAKSKNKENDQHENNQSDTDLSSLALQLSQNVSDEYKKILIKYKNNKACKFLITSFNSNADSDNIQHGLTILNKSDKGKEIIKQLQQALQKYKKQIQN